jgi:hypothetical protein
VGQHGRVEIVVAAAVVLLLVVVQVRRRSSPLQRPGDPRTTHARDEEGR